MTKYIVTYVTDNGDHYHEVFDSENEIIAMVKDPEMDGYYHQVHVFTVSSGAPHDTFTIDENPAWCVPEEHR